MKHTQGEIFPPVGTVDFQNCLLTDEHKVHIAKINNATHLAEIPTEEAVKYIEHGREMVEALKYALINLNPYNHTRTGNPDKACHLIRRALTKLEAK